MWSFRENFFLVFPHPLCQTHLLTSKANMLRSWHLPGNLQGKMDYCLLISDRGTFVLLLRQFETDKKNFLKALVCFVSWITIQQTASRLHNLLCSTWRVCLVHALGKCELPGSERALELQGSFLVTACQKHLGSA